MSESAPPVAALPAHPQPRISRLTALFLLVIGTLAALLGTDLYLSYDRELLIYRQNASNLGDVIERHVRANVDKIDVVLRETVYAYTPSLTSRDKQPVLAANRDLRRREGPIPEAQENSLRVIDADGNVVYSAGETAELPKVNVADRAYFLRQKNEPDAGLVMSEPILSRFTGKWLFTLSRRINHPDGTFAGLVQSAMRADQFETGLQAIDVGRNGNISLFSLVASDVRLMARQPSLPEKLGKSFDLHEVTSAVARGETQGSYRVVSRVDGVDRLYVFRKFDNIPLLVNIGVAFDTLLENWWRKAALYGFSLLLLIAEMVWLVSYQRRTAQRNQALLEQKVTERTHELSTANERLRGAMQAAEAANVAKTQFLATMSHELRTPLNGILGMAQLLELEDTSPEERQEYVQIIIKSGETLLGVVNDILDLSKIEADKTELRISPTNPASIVLDTEALFRPLADKKGLSLLNEVDAPSQTLYRLDPMRLKQMLGNLVNNAVKFTEQGSVTISLRVVEENATDSLLEFAVADTGIGIPADKLDALFKPFSQIDNSSTRNYGGTGLGLSIVRKLAELMDGEAGVASETGKGSRFWFRVRAPHVAVPAEG